MSTFVPKKIADRDETENTIFKYKNLCWEPYYTRTDSLNIKGPLCTQCFIILNPGDTQAVESKCVKCGKNYKTTKTFEELRGEAYLIFDGYLRSKKKVITLDIPVSNVFDEEKDEFHAVKVYLSQKDGKKMALVYILERDGSGDKSQIFVDLENEQVRYDPSDIPPSKLLAKMKVEFKNASQENIYSQ